MSQVLGGWGQLRLFDETVNLRVNLLQGSSQRRRDLDLSVQSGKSRAEDTSVKPGEEQSHHEIYSPSLLRTRRCQRLNLRRNPLLPRPPLQGLAVDRDADGR